MIEMLFEISFGGSGSQFQKNEFFKYSKVLFIINVHYHSGADFICQIWMKLQKPKKIGQ